MRSTAETTGGSSSASRGPASSRPAASKTSTGPHPSHSTDDSSTPLFLDRNEHVLLEGVGKSFIAQALQPSEPGIPSASYIDFEGHGSGQGGPLHGQDLPLLPRPGPAHPRRPRSPQMTQQVHRPLRAGHRQASYRQLRHHLQQGCRRWDGLFDDSILGNSALDRLANASYQIVIEGASYRERLSPHRALLDRKEVDPQT